MTGNYCVYAEMLWQAVVGFWRRDTCHCLLGWLTKLGCRQSTFGQLGSIEKKSNCMLLLRMLSRTYELVGE